MPTRLDMTNLKSMQAGLLKKDDELEAARMSSTDRAKRHGELKQLRTLKREIMKKVFKFFYKISLIINSEMIL